MHKANSSTTAVNDGNKAIPQAQHSSQLSPAAGAAAMALNFLAEIQKIHEQTHGLACSAKHYLNAQKDEPDFFVLNFFDVIDSLLASNDLFHQARQYLSSVAGEGA